MKYQHGNRRKAIEYEKALIDYWKKHNTFQKSIDQNPQDKSYVFYDGPPFITGNPHHGTLLSSVVKDAVPRFWTMNGFRVERRWGWDCHGLPAENFTEKHLGGTVSRTENPKMLELKIGEETSQISLEKYIETARDLMVANSATWESTIDRIGRWVDFGGAYKTMDKDFMESVWWAFKELYEKGKIYEGERVLMYDTNFATPVSKTEVTMDNEAYQTVTDPSVYVKFKLTPDSINKLIQHIDSQAPDYQGERLPLKADIYMLAWTTTPWTLPGNTALAVNSDLQYVLVEKDEEILVLAKDLAGAVAPDYKVLNEISGTDLVGLSYEPIFTPVQGAHKIHTAPYVTTDSGTGIVHLAPIYGEEDFELAEKENIPKLHVLDDHGYYYPEVAAELHKIGVRDTDEKGIEVWTANKFIAKCLEEQGTVWKIDYIRHEYPFNPRSKQRIMYRAIPSWFLSIDKPLMLEQNQNINWFPEYLKNGRFAKNIEQAPDWNLSRDRFWATPMPVWKCHHAGLEDGKWFLDDNGELVDYPKETKHSQSIFSPVRQGVTDIRPLVFGSYEELKGYSEKELDDYHRPWVDEIEFYAFVNKKDPKDIRPLSKNAKGEYKLDGYINVPFRRTEKVLDCWFESGSMPFAQLHYPFENKEKFEKNYPADFIVEYIAQVRAWFYYVHTINTALFGTEAYKNVITTGTLAGNDGRKMSKSLGNYTDPSELMDKYSADALRFLMLSSPVLSGEDFALLDKDVSDIARKLAMIWNVYDFFTMYAEVDGWDSNLGLGGDFAFSDEPKLESPQNPLDVWIISRIYQLRSEITTNMEKYNLPDALAGILPFIDDLSNWFVRRSRRRFWKSEDDTDKNAAYETLHFVLSYLALLLAPFTPFLAEELWQNMVGDKSVHLHDWPAAGTIDQETLNKMSDCRRIITDGLALRMSTQDEHGQIKVRQPLRELKYGGDQLNNFYEQIIAEEVNVKKVTHHTGELALDKKLTPALKQEGFARELIRSVQSARKKAGLQIDDRIHLSISETLPAALQPLIQQETLALTLTQNQNYTYDEIITIDGKQLAISLEKAS